MPEDKKRDPMPPPDATPEEIGEFWDTHNLANYWDETHEVEIQVQWSQRKNVIGCSMQSIEMLVEDCIQTLRKKQKIKKSEYLPSGTIPVVDQGQDFIGGYINDTERSYDGQLPVIVFGDHTCTLKYVDFPFAVGADGTQLIRPTKDFNIRYFYYALRNLPLEQFGYQRHFKYLKTSKIFCPPMQLQRKIAAVLSAYDDLIENNNRRIKILEDMAQTLYREWFVHFRFPGHENVPMVESPLGPIPEGWVVKQLGEIYDVLMGLSPKSEFYNETGEGLPFHQGVTDFGQRFPTDRVYCTVQKRIAEIGDILFSVRAPVGRINVANKKIIIGRGLSAIRSKNGDQAFLLQQLKDRFQEEDTIGSGTIYNAITKSDLLGIQLLKPAKSIVAKFEETVQPIFLELVNLTMKNTNLRQTRDLLLPKLISGEIDVSELDINIDGMQPTKGGTYIPYPLTDRLHSDEKILGGKPVIKGTRLAVAFILDLLKQGWSEEEVVENYPSVAYEDIEACRAYQEKVKRASVSR